MRVPLFRPSVSRQDIEVFADVLDSGHLTTGPKCAEFEAAFAECLGVRHALSTNSGTAALHLALATICIAPGDVVFVPTMAFASDVQVVEWMGALPVLVDCDPCTLCMDVEKLRETIERLRGEKSVLGREIPPERMRAVIVVDYGGQMADCGALKDLCNEYGLVFIEDASHALPAAWRRNPESPWQSPGNLADFACFSFYANKPITTGEGGMVVTNDDQWAADMRVRRLHGLEPMSSSSHESNWSRQVMRAGFKYNLSDLSAALGIRQLSRVKHFADARRAIASAYDKLLGDCPLLELPMELPNRRHSWHLYAIRLRGGASIEKRDAIMETLYQRGVETSVHWYPLHLHQFYCTRIPRILDFPVAEAAYSKLISLPIFPSMTVQEVEFVASTLLQIINAVKSMHS